MTKSPESTNIWDVGDISLAELVGSEKEYEKFYKHRKARLSKMNFSSQGLASHLANAMVLTDASNLIATKLRSTIDFVNSRFPLSTDDKLDLLSQTWAQARSQVAGPFSSRLEESDRKAIEFLRWFYSDRPKATEDMTLGDALKAQFKDESQSGLELIAMKVDIGIKIANPMAGSASTALLAINLLLIILRGILYVIIFSDKGGKLDRRKTADRVFALTKELAAKGLDALPGFSLLTLVVSLKEILFAWLEIDNSMELIEQADFVEGYFETYTNLLTQWVAVAITVNNSSVGIVNVTLRKQALAPLPVSSS